MVLYRLGDAIDTLSQISRVVAHHYREMGWAEHDLLSYLQPGQARSRTAAPIDSDRAYLAGFLGHPAPQPDTTGMYSWGQSTVEHIDANQRVINTQAVLHALTSNLEEDLAYSVGDLQGPARELALQLLPLLAQHDSQEPSLT
ncbi:hypothetical protein [Streptomyces vinaceus]|uniref:hypothetical protein n=1 Tax=Streptomyces vinaceus TaxID=1960 RepID=UPI0038295A83